MRTCEMPTTSLQLCRRVASVAYVRDDAALTIVAAYCRQHDTAGGHSAMLRPASWEYDRKVTL